MQKRFLGIFLIMSLQIYCGKSPMFPEIDSRYLTEQEPCGDNSLLQANLGKSYRVLSAFFKQFCTKSSDLLKLMKVLENEQKCFSHEDIDLLIKPIDTLLENKKELDIQWQQIEAQRDIIKLRDLASDNG